MDRPHVIRPRRFPISRRGELTYEEHRFACLVQDISEQGMFIICNYDLDVGLELDVKFELEAGLPYQARIKVRHFSDGCFGAEIVEADPQSAANWIQFLESNFAGQLRLPERRSRR
jgi:PilZ domain-containing protein